jgi:hypothetical protein
MDLEDDTHMETTVKTEEIVNVSIMLGDAMLNVIAKRLADRIEAMDIEQMIDDRIEDYMTSTFDINDYTNNLDTYEITRGIVDHVIETIKDRL